MPNGLMTQNETAPARLMGLFPRFSWKFSSAEIRPWQIHPRKNLVVWHSYGKWPRSIRKWSIYILYISVYIAHSWQTLRSPEGNSYNWHLFIRWYPHRPIYHHFSWTVTAPSNPSPKWNFAIFGVCVWLVKFWLVNLSPEIRILDIPPARSAKVSVLGGSSQSQCKPTRKLCTKDTTFFP